MYQAPPTLTNADKIRKWCFANAYLAAALLGLLLLHIPTLSFRFLPASTVRPGVAVAILIYSMMIFVTYRLTLTSQRKLLQYLALLQMAALLVLSVYTFLRAIPLELLLMPVIMVGMFGGPIGLRIMGVAASRATKNRHQRPKSDSETGGSQ